MLRPALLQVLAAALAPGLAQAATVVVTEYYNAALDHYFITPPAPDVAALDDGVHAGWTRTGRAFGAWPDAASGGPQASPVCRYYLPPGRGDSHFFSASADECAAVERLIATQPDYAGIVRESSAAFWIGLPDAASGACAAGLVPVYRVWNRRGDTNHRYTSDRLARDAMLAKGWVAEGYGPDAVAMCAPPLPGPALSRASGPSPFAAECTPTGGGIVYVDAEVEPSLAANPLDPRHLVGVWQQDRYSNGSARGIVAGVSRDGGRTWTRTPMPFSRCGGGTAGNGGDWERASDPWVAFGPDGTVWQSALVTSGGSFIAGSRNAIAVSRSSDGGRTWSDARALIVDGEAFFNDKEAIAADPFDARTAYAAWDRLRRSGGGPSVFARTTDGGATWSAPRELHDPGDDAQTINNIPLVAGDGTLLVFFTRLTAAGGGRTAATLQVMRSSDRGATWSGPAQVAAIQSVGTTDPQTGAKVRDGAILASVAAGPGGQVAAVWQDARYAGGAHDGIALARSSDGGATWSAPVQVNRDGTVPAFVPAVAFLPDGTLGVSYYDFRANTREPSTLYTDTWLATSRDGVAWQETRIAPPFDMAAAPVANGRFVGDYTGLAAAGGAFHALVATAHAGEGGNRSDVYHAAVDAATADAKRTDRAYRAGPAAAALDEAAIAARVDAAVRDVLARRGRPALPR